MCAAAEIRLYRKLQTRPVSTILMQQYSALLACAVHCALLLHCT
jgi:hypothetical protein